MSNIYDGGGGGGVGVLQNMGGDSQSPIYDC